MQIEFNEKVEWHSGYIVFWATIGGKTLANRVTRIVLDDYFGADAGKDSEESAYRQNIETIREVARRMFAAGVVQADGSIMITNDAFVRFDPHR